MKTNPEHTDSKSHVNAAVLGFPRNANAAHKKSHQLAGLSRDAASAAIGCIAEPIVAIHGVNSFECQRFLALLDPDQDRFLFSSFDDDKERAKLARAKKVQGVPASEMLSTLDDAIAWMNKRQALGANITVTAQAMKGGKRRRLGTLKYIRCVFAEMDVEPTKAWPLKPSIIVETSPGHYHVYWLIDMETPMDGDTFEGIQKRLVLDYGADNGAKDLARTLRLPGTWNLKPGRAPHLVTVIDESGYRYSVDELMAAFPPVPRTVPSDAPRPDFNRFRSPGDLGRFVEPLKHIDSNDYFTWLEVGMALHAESGGGAEGLRTWDAWSATSKSWSAGECEYRWRTFRVGGGLTGGKVFHLAADAGYRKPEKAAPKGKAKQSKSETAYGDAPKAEPDPKAERAKPQICLRAGSLHVMADDAMKALVDAGVDIFQRGGKLMRPAIIKGVDSKGRSVGASVLVEVDKIFMRKMLCQHIEWLKFDGRAKAWKETDAPKEIAEMVVSMAGLWTFRTIGGIISTPTLRFDGSILSEQGYDETTGLFLDSHVALPAMPDKPTRREAEAALKLLKDLLTEFPFVDAASASVALSAMLTTVGRGMIDVAPAHGARAPAAGTGKSYLFDIASAILQGERCPVISVSSDSEGETEKRIIGMAMSGQQIIHLDNVNGTLGGDALCQVIERPICLLRPLGKSEPVRIQNRAVVFFNGNNCRVQGDMTRRVVVADLDARMEKPAEREFKSDPVATVLANRGAYIAACMTVLRGYQAAGSPKVTKVPMNSFGEWSNTIRSALIWLGEVDPCETIQKARDEDPELQKLAVFIEALKELKGTGLAQSCTTGDIIFEAQREIMGSPVHSELHDCLMQFGRAGKVDARSFGRWLLGVKQRIVGSHCINSVMDKKKKVQRWYVEAM